jgi:hypothetical protein
MLADNALEQGVDRRRGLDAAFAGEDPGDEIGRPLWRRCGRGRRRGGTPDQEWTDNLALVQQRLQSKADPQVCPLVMLMRLTGEHHCKERATKSAVERLEHGATPAIPEKHAADKSGCVPNDRGAAQAGTRCGPACDAHLAFRHRHWRASVIHRFPSD